MAGRSSTPAADSTWECLVIPSVETANQGARSEGRYMKSVSFSVPSCSVLRSYPPSLPAIEFEGCGSDVLASAILESGLSALQDIHYRLV